MNIAIVTKKNVVSHYVTANRIYYALKDRECESGRVRVRICDFEERDIPEQNILYVDVVYSGSLSYLSKFLPGKNVVFYATCEGFPMIDPAGMEREVADKISIVPCSRFVKLCLETVGLTVKEPVYHGIDMAQKTVDSKFMEWVKDAWSKKSPVVLCVSGNSERKGLDRYMLACKIVSERLRPLKPKFILHSGEGFVKIPAVMNDLELRDLWYTASFGMWDEPKMNSLYSLCSVYVQPSYTEGFGLPMIEAYRFNKPVVAVDAQPFNEIVTDGKTGRLIPCRNVENFKYLDRFMLPMHVYSVEDLADAIQSLLEASPTQGAEMSKGIEDAKTLFGESNYGKLVDGFF